MDPSDYMAQALRLSHKALPDCQPNPPVGCVIVKDDQVIAEGFTLTPGQHHAEAAALATASEAAVGSHVYVTLEPCSFQGRTPSCAKALIEAQVSKVFVAMLDPDPRNNGKGLELLRAANIEVELGILQASVSQFLTPYLAVNNKV